MGLGRHAPHRVRAAYARTLAAIPLQVRSIAAPAPEAITVLGRAEIDDRAIHFGTMTSAPRLWIAFAEADQRVFGYLTGLASGEIELHLLDAAPAWALQDGHAAALKRHGLAVWEQAKRWCEG